MTKIKCKECDHVLAVSEKGWFKIKGSTDYSSNGTDSYITCRKCKTINKIK